MKKKLAFMLTLIFMLSVLLTGVVFGDDTAVPVVTTSTEITEVLFSSPGLETEIRGILVKPTEQIMPADLLGITKLSLKKKEITGIEALMFCTNLKELDLSGNLISDILPLMDLSKLTKVDLTGNPIHPKDIAALKAKVPKAVIKQDPINQVSKFKGMAQYAIVITNKSKSSVNLFAGHSDPYPSYSLTKPGATQTVYVMMSSLFFTEAEKNSFAGATWVNDKLRLNVKKANKSTITKTFSMNQSAYSTINFVWDGSKLKQVVK